MPKDRSEFSITAPEAGRKVVELVPEAALEAARAEGIAAASLSTELERFINDLETARMVYQDPVLRPFLDLSDEAVESEFEAMRRAMKQLDKTVQDAIGTWFELQRRRRPRAVFQIREFFKSDDDGGAE